MNPAAKTPRAPVLGLVATALGLLLVTAFLLRPAGDPTLAPAPTPDPPRAAVATPGGGPSSTDGGDLAAPTVTATPKVDAVEFGWSVSGARSGDTFRVQVGATAADAEIADPVTVSKPPYAVTVAGGSPVCLLVAVVRTGQTSPASSSVCASAR